MKTVICLLAVAFLSSGCIRRTVVQKTEHRGEGPSKKKFGSDPHDAVLETEIIWVWQKEFRNPK
ncbi:MAG: hypothetical protein U9P12_08665 [Verrucomicrobiota bacterium]|nr:hypothetical protein [Verrucomicrobiota bacterium]